ncbi:hypothetical protein L6164_036286 [Bauhinia variegata]|uniref:Uncharacterized protein n=1 Tax=Bauhinia variegata TaxID=167791 RepID=A0ACB9KGJ3_BAUVA|nr:hypothetical protein L6164_036286 [Bauhinia variegata]
MRRIVEFLMRDASLPPLPVDLHCEFLRPIMESWDNSAEDSASSSRMSSSKSYSLSSFDKALAANHITRLTF